MACYEVKGRRNYYMEFGQGRPILLLHGISNSGRAWGPQIPALVAAGYRVIVPDHAGHGASDPLTAPFGVADIADDTEQLLARLGIETLDVVGLSLGGMVALELAVRRPTGIGRLVVANSFDNTATPEFRAMSEGWASVFEQPHGPVTRLEQNWLVSVSETFRNTPEGMRTYQVWHGIAATSHGPSLAHVARGIADFDISGRLAELAMPTLFIAGELDRMSPPDLSRRMAEKTPQAKLCVIEGAAHISNADSPDDFTARLLRFLSLQPE
ncbi:alpha/beta fold hydrolase [Rhodovulum sulfidophilum]|uniref:alpha/beta fold hydrolase n=1 Tax=Rhodovulum sulfidophilum TaxID=35806 RepID=UPI001923CC32|nr:alpha/beta fold hydrolase [Rhodovulum sulfidophilum]MBL3595070.1 alpha/beta fold hydrolase [Rhodovulum sulfidophilum]